MSDSPAVHTERMSRVDTAWLRMDNDANLMMIVGVWLVEPELRLDEVRERVQERLLKYDRFRQKVVEDTMGATWVEDGSFDIADHVLGEDLILQPGQSPVEALKVRVGHLAATPLASDRPRWEIRLVERLDAGRSALIIRIHHCIGDGIALTSVMLSITDGGKPPPERKHREPEGEHDWVADLLKPVTDLTIKAIGLTGDGMAKSVELMANPVQPLAGGMEIARVGYQVISDAAAMALMPDDSPTLLKGKATPGKRVAWGEPLPLEEVKAVGQAFGASINDVLLTAVAGAIGGKVAAKDRPVVALVGDGAFAMNGMEVHTAVENDIPVVWLVMNNGGHGMVHVGETLQFKGKFNTAQFNQRLDVAKIADAVGALSFVVDRAGDTEKALRQALASGRPCVIDVRTDPEAMPPTGIRLATLERFFQGRG